MDATATSSRTRGTETYYPVRWLGFPPAEDTWEPCEHMMEDIADVVKEYEVALALIFNAGSLEHKHDLLSVIAQAFPRHRSLGNDAAVVTGISDEVPAKSRGARRRDKSNDDHTRGIDMDVSAATRPLRRSPIIAPCSHPVVPASRVREGVGTTDRRLTRPNLPSGPADAMDCQLSTQCLRCVRPLPRCSLQPLSCYDSTHRE
ncbi:unnamed protein product [Phytophthora fragariaefolia]|uniref:Unnamed protein product n=1 Tax=Phytophthora fragariaefolia TaxID=1490495 RepID=A0A9W6TZ58_9STRA|nr:unnamed protein product [Phytophthora fragariaefolia]